MINLVGNISNYLSKDKLKGNEMELRRQLALLSGKLKMHLTMEDQSLYPRLMESDNTALRDLSKKYNSEMGHIKGEFENYMSAWPSYKAIEESPDRFISETKAIFEVLGARIAKEDKELYPLADLSGAQGN